MMKLLKHTHTLAIIALLISACEIQNNNLEHNRQVVVNGWIEPGKPAHVILTYTVPYFSDTHFDTNNIYNFVNARAKVTVFGNDTSEILRLETDSRYFPPFVYKGRKLKGKPGEEYRIKIEEESLILTANTYIPDPIQIDSIWFSTEEGYDTLGFFNLSLTDAPSQKNYYRILYSYRNSNEMNEILFANLSDELFEDSTFILSAYKATIDQTLYNEDILFSRNDEVLFKVYSMTESAFNFYRTLQLESINTFNPFAESKQRVESNINGGGLGLWTGYSVTGKIVISQ